MIRFSQFAEFVDVGGVIHVARCHKCKRRLYQESFTICPFCHWFFCATHECYELHIFDGRTGKFCLEKHHAPVRGSLSL